MSTPTLPNGNSMDVNHRSLCCINGTNLMQKNEVTRTVLTDGVVQIQKVITSTNIICMVSIPTKKAANKKRLNAKTTFTQDGGLPIEALLNPEKEDDLTQKRPRAAA